MSTPFGRHRSATSVELMLGGSGCLPLAAFGIVGLIWAAGRPAAQVTEAH